MTGWRILTLRQAGVELIDCVHKTPAARSEGFPYVAIPDMKSGRIDFSNARRISPSDFVEWTRKAHPRRYDVVLSRRTNPGVTAVDDTGTEFALGQNLVLLRADGNAVHPPFLRWLCRGPEWWGQIEKYLNVGAVFSSLRCGDVPNFEFTIPTLTEQCEIASILGALDDKIELNRRMATTLEEMARALYRSWFVDFDPVKAKAEGLAPAFMDEATAALFPDRFGDDGLPEGWRLRSLGEFFKFQRGLSYKGKFLTEAGAPMINLGCFKGDGGFDSAKIKNYSGETKERNWVQPGDLVFANTDMTQNRLILGSPHIVEGNSDEALLYSHHVFAGRPTTTESRLWTRFLFFQLLQPEFRDRAEGFATGTTVLFLPADAAEALSFAAPDLRHVQAFNDETDPWLERSRNLRSENRGLAELRDTLLPKLMSGELRVGDAKAQIEEVA